MNEIYKLLVNLLEIGKANNMFLNTFEPILSEILTRLDNIEKKLTIETSGPDVPGTENVENQ